jgi:hypothetical protein
VPRLLEKVAGECQMERPATQNDDLRWHIDRGMSGHVRRWCMIVELGPGSDFPSENSVGPGEQNVPREATWIRKSRRSWHRPTRRTHRHMHCRLCPTHRWLGPTGTVHRSSARMGCAGRASQERRQRTRHGSPVMLAPRRRARRACHRRHSPSGRIRCTTRRINRPTRVARRRSSASTIRPAPPTSRLSAPLSMYAYARSRFHLFSSSVLRTLATKFRRE